MGNVLSGLFGGKPSTPKLVTQATPIEKVQQSNIADDTTLKQLAKLRRATMLAQQGMGDATIKRQTLGAGA